MAPRRHCLSVESDALHVRGGARRDHLLHGLGVEVLDGDCGADIEETVVDGVFGDKGR